MSKHHHDVRKILNKCKTIARCAKKWNKYWVTLLWLLSEGSSVKWVFLHVQRINISLCWPDLAPLDGLWHGCVRARLADAVSKLRPRGVKCRCRGRCIGLVTDLSLFIRKSKTNKQIYNQVSFTGNRSALRTKSPFRPTISAPIMNEGQRVLIGVWQIWHQ